MFIFNLGFQISVFNSFFLRHPSAIIVPSVIKTLWLDAPFQQDLWLLCRIRLYNSGELRGRAREEWMKTVLACGTDFGARRDQHQTIHNYITSLAINGGEILGEIGKIVIQTPAHFMPNASRRHHRHPAVREDHIEEGSSCTQRNVRCSRGSLSLSAGQLPAWWFFTIWLSVYTFYIDFCYGSEQAAATNRLRLTAPKKWSKLVA